MPHILIIDDSLFQRRLIRKIVVSLGYEVTEAANGAEGFALLQNHTYPDCILLDLMMPDMDGLEFLEILQAHAIHIPTIVATADIQTTTAQTCYGLGAIAVLYKPIKTDELVTHLNNILPLPQIDGSQ